MSLAAIVPASSVTRGDAIESLAVETPGDSYGGGPTTVTSIPARGFPAPSSMVAVIEPAGTRATFSAVAAEVLTVVGICWGTWVSSGGRMVISTGPGARSVRVYEPSAPVVIGGAPSWSLYTVAPARGRWESASVTTPLTVAAPVSARFWPVIAVVPTTVIDAVVSPNPGAIAVTV